MDSNMSIIEISASSNANPAAEPTPTRDIELPATPNIELPGTPLAATLNIALSMIPDIERPITSEINIIAQSSKPKRKYIFVASEPESDKENDEIHTLVTIPKRGRPKKNPRLVDTEDDCEVGPDPEDSNTTTHIGTRSKKLKGKSAPVRRKKNSSSRPSNKDSGWLVDTEDDCEVGPDPEDSDTTTHIGTRSEKLKGKSAPVRRKKNSSSRPSDKDSGWLVDTEDDSEFGPDPEDSDTTTHIGTDSGTTTHIGTRSKKLKGKSAPVRRKKNSSSRPSDKDSGPEATADKSTKSQGRPMTAAAKESKARRENGKMTKPAVQAVEASLDMLTHRMTQLRLTRARLENEAAEKSLETARVLLEVEKEKVNLAILLKEAGTDVPVLISILDRYMSFNNHRDNPSPEVMVANLSAQAKGKAKAMAPPPNATYKPASTSHQSHSSRSASVSTPSTNITGGLRAPFQHPAPFPHPEFPSNTFASSSSTPFVDRGMPAMAGGNAVVYQQSSLEKSSPTPQLRPAVSMYPSRLPLDSSNMYC